MGNQMNVHFINREKMLAAKVGDVFSDEVEAVYLPVEGRAGEPLLDFLRESLIRIGEEDEELRSDIEQDDLLGIIQEDWNPEAVTWVITFEASWAVDDDLLVVQKHVEGSVKERLPGPQNAEGGDFPASIPDSSPFRAFDVGGWQFFDKEEFDDVVEGVIRARKVANGTPGDGMLHEDYEEEWDHVEKAWRKGGYDLVLFWWLM